jgi:type IV secretory pathway TrbD component
VIGTLPEWAQAAMTLVALLWMASFGAPIWAYALPVLIFLCAANVERD